MLQQSLKMIVPLERPLEMTNKKLLKQEVEAVGAVTQIVEAVHRKI